MTAGGAGEPEVAERISVPSTCVEGELEESELKVFGLSVTLDLVGFRLLVFLSSPV